MGAALRTEIVERAAPAVDAGVTHDWRHWPDEPWILFVILGAALIILTGTIQVVHRLDRDEGAFLVIAQAILHGRVPYRDVFDHKSPAIYYLVAAVLALTSRLSLMQQIVALRIVVALANLTTAAGLLLLGKRWKSLEIGALAAALWLIALPLYTGVYAFTEPFATAPTIWAFVVASRKPTWRSSAGAGLLLALASLFKQTVVLAIPAAALLVFCGLLPARRWLPPARALLANAGALLAGLIAPWLMVVGIFFVLGGGPQLFQDVVIANFHYPPDTPSGLVRGVVSDVDLFPFLWLTALLVICLGSWIWLRNRSRARERFNPGLVAAALAGLLNLVPLLSHAFAHYLIQVLPWAALLTAYAIMSIVERARSWSWVPQADLSAANRTLRRLVLPVLFGVLIATSSSNSLAVTVHLGAQSLDLRTQIAAGTWIRDQIAPSSRLLVAPAQPELYYLSGHRPVTPFVYLLPVNLTPDLIAQVTDDIRHGQFDAVVWQLHQDGAKESVAPEFSEMYGVLTARYYLASTYAPLDLLLFKPNAAGGQQTASVTPTG